jgi:hypothetical protein
MIVDVLRIKGQTPRFTSRRRGKRELNAVFDAFTIGKNESSDEAALIDNLKRLPIEAGSRWKRLQAVFQTSSDTWFPSALNHAMS